MDGDRSRARRVHQLAGMVAPGRAVQLARQRQGQQIERAHALRPHFGGPGSRQLEQLLDLALERRPGTDLHQGADQVGVRLGELWVGLERRVQVFHRRDRVVAMNHRDAEIVERAGVTRIELDRAREQREPFVKAPGLDEHHAEVAHRRNVVRPPLGGALQRRSRRRQLAPFPVLDAAPVVPARQGAPVALQEPVHQAQFGLRCASRAREVACAAPALRG
jgi:hypothetical protein